MSPPAVSWLNSTARLQNGCEPPPTIGTRVYRLSAMLAGCELGLDVVERACHVGADLVRADNHHAIAVLGEPFPLIGTRARRRLILFGWHPIDDAPQRKRDEVGDVRPDRHLPLEAASGKAAVVHQRLPER